MISTFKCSAVIAASVTAFALAAIAAEADNNTLTPPPGMPPVVTSPPLTPPGLPTTGSQMTPGSSLSAPEPDTTSTPPPMASTASGMDEGIKAYSNGNYSDAIAHLKDALNSEFNSAKLHYYMGACYMKLKRKDLAVREFRIAYALEPGSTPGKYAKKALDMMDIDRDVAEKPSNTVYPHNRRDQRDLSQAMVDYEREKGVLLVAPAFNGSFTPPGFKPGQGTGQPAH
jgi:hypothetical protein